MSNLNYMNREHQVCAESYSDGCMVEYSIVVVIQTDSYWAQTSPPVIPMTRLTSILFVYFVTNYAVAFSVHRNQLTDTGRFGPCTAWFIF